MTTIQNQSQVEAYAIKCVDKTDAPRANEKTWTVLMIVLKIAESGMPNAYMFKTFTYHLKSNLSLENLFLTALCAGKHRHNQTYCRTKIPIKDENVIKDTDVDDYNLSRWLLA